MRFSIVIPVYNVENYIRECVDSILCQNFDDYELILVNDGSSDSSLEICNEYKVNHSSVVVVDKPNGGSSSARNAGLLEASGDYVVFLDSDDFLLGDDFLQSVSEAIGDSDMLMFKHRKYDDALQKFSEWSYSYESAIEADGLGRQLRSLVEADAFFCVAWNKCIKREILIHNNIWFREGIVAEDIEWFYELIPFLTSVTFLDRAFLAYRQRAGSVTKACKLKNYLDNFVVLEKQINKVANMDEGLLKDALAGGLAKLYSNLLIMYVRVNDPEKQKYKQSLKEMRMILSAGLSNRPIVVNRFMKVFGFSATLWVLSLLDRKNSKSF